VTKTLEKVFWNVIKKVKNIQFFLKLFEFTGLGIGKSQEILYPLYALCVFAKIDFFT